MPSLALVSRYESAGRLSPAGRARRAGSGAAWQSADRRSDLGVAIVLAMATAGAIIVRSLFRRTLANVSATAAAIAAGDFAQRVKVSGRGDEFDQLAEVINDMLDRIGRLMDGVRQVSNAIAHDLRTPITRARARLEEAARTPRPQTICMPRSIARPSTSTASSRCSRRCCASPKSRPGRAAPRSRVSISYRCWKRSPICMGGGGGTRSRSCNRYRTAGGRNQRRRGADPAGGRQSRRQRGQVLPAREHGAADRHVGAAVTSCSSGSGRRNTRGRQRQGDGSFLSRRSSAQHAGGRPRPVAGAGRRAIAWRQPAAR